MSQQEAELTVHGVTWTVRATANADAYLAQPHNLKPETRAKWIRFLEARMSAALADPAVARAIEIAIRQAK